MDHLKKNIGPLMPNNIISLFYKKYIYIYSIFSLFAPPTQHFCSRTIVGMVRSAIYIYNSKVSP